ncbi:MAG: filamentous hemagglutinin family N-terminal domain, partial [Phormidium sp. OSCR]
MDDWQWGWAVSLGLGMAIVPIVPIQAQIIPDGSLGNEGSVTTPTETGVQIDGGALRGDNLFHSFQEFSIPTNSEAFFNNPDVANIFSRVTGGSISDIDGLLRANGTANLFLLNPNGIIFGPNARLDIGGSFVASTANSLVFENSLAFNAEESGEAPLLRVNVPLGVQFNDNPGRIEATGAILNVSEGEAITLVGGEISLDDVEINAPAGRIDLVGVGGAGQVSFEVGDITSGFPSEGFGIPRDLNRASVSLDETTLNVTGLVGGEIGIQALDLEMRNSLLEGGIVEGLGFEDGQSGNIKLDAMGNISISGSLITNSVRQGSLGNAGDINLVANTIEVTGGSGLNSSVSGVGNAGNIRTQASDSIILSGENSAGFPTRVSSRILETGQGNAGQVSVVANTVELLDLAQLSSVSFGQGNAGDIRVEAHDRAVFSAANFQSNEFPTGIGTIIGETGRGNAGNITVIANDIEVRDGAELNSMNSGEGNAGNIRLEAGENLGFSDGYVFSGIGETGRGNGGNIRVMGNRVDIQNGSRLSSDTWGQGDAGEINLLGRHVQVSNAAQLSSSTFSEGDAGNVTIEAHETVQLLNVGVLSDVAPTAQGNAGNLSVIGDRVEIRDGTRLSSNTLGQGNAGRINIYGNEAIIFSGQNSNGSPSTALSNVAGVGPGDAGDINLFANSIEVSDGAHLFSTNLSEGNTGNVTIEGRSTVQLLNANVASAATGRGNSGSISVISDQLEIRNDSVLRSSVLGQGNAGDINLLGNSIELSDRARLSSNTFGEGNAGNIIIESNNSVRLLDANVLSNVEAIGQGNAGNIRILGDHVEVLGGSQLNSSVLGQGNGGQIDIYGAQAIIFSGENSEGSPSAALTGVGTRGRGNAGDINLLGHHIEVSNRAQLSSSTFGEGDAGNITIESHGTVQLLDGRVLSNVAETVWGNAGNISIIGNRVEVRNGAQLNSSTLGQGDAARVDIYGTEAIVFSGENSEGLPSAIFSDVAETGRGNAGDLNLLSEHIEIHSGARLSSGTLGEGNAGNLTLEAGDTVILSNANVLSNVAETGQGNAGNISVIGTRVEVRDGTRLSSSTWGQGNA